VIVNVFSVILCILCFRILFYIVAGYPALLSSSYIERISDDDGDDDDEL